MQYIIQKGTIFILLLVHTLWLSAQENQEQKLIDLLTSGRFFEAEEFYNQAEKDSIFAPFFRLYYKYEMTKMQYKNDSAAVFLEQLLEDGDRYWGIYKYHFYDQLLELYVNKLQDFPKALSTCERMEEYLEENPFNVDEENIRNGLKYTKERKQQILKREQSPTIKSSRDCRSNIVKMKDDNNILFFDATYNNNNTIKTMFDTGASYHFIMKEKVADSIGVRRMSVFDNDSSIVFNDVVLPMEEGILDSVEIANIKLYNIPVLIYKFDPTSNIPDSWLNDNLERKRSVEYMSQSIDVIMGYPTMFLIGKILIDFRNNILSFPDNSLMSPNILNDPNLFVYKNNLFTHLCINDIPFTAHLDFGSSSYMQLHSSFYEKHKNKIPIKHLKKKKDINIAMLHRTWFNIPYEIAKNPELRFNDKIIPSKKNQVIEIYSLPEQAMPEIFDGHIGYPFLNDLGKKILLDFDNMRIDIIK
jgi:hypothetical protein